MKKHAYLIMAYNNPGQLAALIKLLDDPRNDIFVHIDKDADFPMESLSSLTTASQLIITPRISVRWGHFSQVRAEFLLLSCAIKNDKYAYYHLLSGMDFPIKTQDEIHAFFADKTQEFLAIVPTESSYNLQHVMCRYPLLGLKSYRKSKILKYISEGFASVQMLAYKMGIYGKNRKIYKNGMRFYDGWNWFSITDNFARYVIESQRLIEKIFCSAKAPDEMFMQTLIMNSPFADKLYCPDNLSLGSMRMIDWERGSPYVFKEQDLDDLINSPYLFARKLDERIDDKIIKHLSEALTQ